MARQNAEHEEWAKIVAEIIHLRKIIQARRREQQQESAARCVEIVEQSLRRHIEEFAHAPHQEWAVRATKIRQLGEILEYSTQMV